MPRHLKFPLALTIVADYSKDQEDTNMNEQLNYLICATHRSGSSLLCEGLRKTRCCGKPREFISPTRSEIIFERGDVSIDPRDDFNGYLSEILEKERTENGVFGAKVMWKQICWLPGRLGNHIAERKTRKLYLSLSSVFGEAPCIFVWRADKLKQAISLNRAKQSGVYSAPQLVGRGEDQGILQPVYQADVIKETIDRFTSEEAKWRIFFKINKIVPLEICYETFIDNFEKTIYEVLDFLGIAHDDLQIRPPASNQKLADDTSREWYERYLDEHPEETFGIQPQD